MNRSLGHLLFSFALILLSPFSSSAATLSPDVQAVLQSAPVGQEVPVIITLSSKADLSAIKEKEKVKRREKIVKALEDEAGLTQGPLKALLQGRGAKRVIPLWITNSVAATISPAVISELMSFPGIENIELDGVVPSPVVTPAAASTPEWNIAKINAPALWAAGITGAGVVVANMDTGVDINHPDVQPVWKGGADSWFNPYSDPLNSSYCGAPGSCTLCELDAAAPCDDSGHGTGTMGVMVGGSAGGTTIGVAPGAQWIAVKIFPSPPARSAQDSIILQGFQWLIGLPAGSAPDVINNSWGGNAGVCDKTFLYAIEALKAAGADVVFAAGNAGPGGGTSESPANNAGSFAVGATYSDDTIASFSSRGPSACDGSVFPHVVAPGVGIRTASTNGRYALGQGTSFSAPHVAGAAALLLSAFPSLTPAEIETALESTAVSLGTPVPNNDYGYGRIDVAAAYKNIFLSVKGDNPQIAAFPPSQIFSNTEVGLVSASSVFTIVNQGTADLLIGPSPGGVSVTGADPGDFLLTSDTCSGATVPSLGSCNVGVVFSPSAASLRSAELTVFSNDPASPRLFISLGGRGVLPGTIARMQSGTKVATYGVIQTAYGNCADGDVIAMEAATFYESPVFSSPLTVDLEGGYDPSFFAQEGVTTISGTLTVSGGTVTIGNVILQ